MDKKIGQQILAYEQEIRAVKRTRGTIRWLLTEVVPADGSADMMTLRRELERIAARIEE